MATKKTLALSVNNLHPTPGYVLIEPAEAQKQTVSGIYLPDSHDEQIQHGQILAVGDSIFADGKEITAPAKVGTMVVYKKWGGNEVKIGDTEYQFLKFEDVLAIVK
jgi:chaperonin GroES